MSIVTEIQRLQTAKTDIKAAIENKGVTVDDGTIDTYAEKIADIVGSGQNIVEGTVIFEDNAVNTLVIEHNLGITPDLFLLLPDYEIDYTVNAENAAIIASNETIQSFALSADATAFAASFETREAYGTYGAWFTVNNANLTETTAKLPIRNSIYNYRVGVPYKWIAVTIEGKAAGGGDYNQGYEDGHSVGALPVYYVSDINNFVQGSTFPENTDLVIRVKTIPYGQNAAFMNTKNLRSIKLIGENKGSADEDCSQTIRHSEDLELVDITEWKVTPCRATYFVYECYKLKTILGAFDLSKSTANTGIFGRCNALEDVEFVPNTVITSLPINACPLLTDTSIQSIIDGLADLTGSDTQTLTLYADVGAKLTDEQKATVTAKNWTLAY